MGVNYQDQNTDKISQEIQTMAANISDRIQAIDNALRVDSGDTKTTNKGYTAGTKLSGQKETATALAKKGELYLSQYNELKKGLDKQDRNLESRILDSYDELQKDLVFLNDLNINDTEEYLDLLYNVNRYGKTDEQQLALDCATQKVQELFDEAVGLYGTRMKNDRLRDKLGNKVKNDGGSKKASLTQIRKNSLNKARQTLSKIQKEVEKFNGNNSGSGQVKIADKYSKAIAEANQEVSNAGLRFAKKNDQKAFLQGLEGAQTFGNAKIVEPKYSTKNQHVKSQAYKNKSEISKATQYGLYSNIKTDQEMKKLASNAVDVQKFVKDTNALILDTETQGLNNQRAVTLGYRNSKSNGSQEVLVNTETLGQDLYDMLSNPGLRQASNQIAERLGLKYSEADNTYKTKDNKVLTPKELKQYTTHIGKTVNNKGKLDAGTFKTYGNKEISYDAYAAMTPDQVQDLVDSASAIYAANPGFDERALTNVAGTKFNESKIHDIFNVVEEAGKLHSTKKGDAKVDRNYRKNWSVESLQEVFLNEAEKTQAEKLHSAGADAEVESMLAAKINSNPELAAQVINNIEESMESTYKALNGHDANIGSVDVNGEFEYSPEYKSFRNQQFADKNSGILAQARQKFQGTTPNYEQNLNDAKKQYDDATKNSRSNISKNLKDSLGNFLESAGLTPEQREGYQKYFGGDTIKNRIEGITGESVKDGQVSSISDYIDNLDTVVRQNDLYADYSFHESNGEVFLDVQISQSSRDGKTNEEMESEIANGNIKTFNVSYTLGGEKSQTNYKNAASVSQMFITANGKRQDELGMEAGFKTEEAIRLIRNGYKKSTGETVVGDEISKTIKNYSNVKMGQYGVQSYSGKSLDEYSGAVDETTRYQDRILQTEQNLTPLFQDLMKEKNLKEWITKDLTQNGKIDLNAVQDAGQSDTYIRSMTLAAEYLKNSTADQREAYKQEREASGQTDDLFYQLVFTDVGKAFREQIEAISGVLTSGTQSVNKTGSGKLQGTKEKSSWSQYMLGRDKTDSTIKTKPTTESTKADEYGNLVQKKLKGVEGDINAFQEKNINDIQSGEKQALETPEAFLPKAVLEQYMSDQGLHLGVSDEWVFGSQDWAEANKGVGQQKTSDALDNNELENLLNKVKLLDESGDIIDPDSIRKLQNGGHIDISSNNNKIDKTWLGQNFAIPEDAYLEDIFRDDSGDFKVRYRQSGDIQHGSKVIGEYGERSEVGIIANTLEELQQGLLNAVNELQASGELTQVQADAYSKNIKKSVIFREDNAKRQSSLRTNTQYVAPSISSLFQENAENIDNILNSGTKFGNFAKQFFTYNEQNKTFNPNTGLDFTNYQATDADKEFLGPQATVDDVIASLNSKSGEFSFLENLINNLYTDESEKLAAQTRGSTALNLFGKTTFYGQSGSTFGTEAEKLNEVALYGENESHLSRVSEELNTARDYLINKWTTDGLNDKQYTKPEAEKFFDVMRTKILKSHTVQGPRQNAALAKYNSIIGSFGANQNYQAAKQYQSTMDKNVDFDYAQFDTLLGKMDSPENNKFSEEEYNDSFVSDIYKMANSVDGASIGNGKTSFTLKISDLLESKGYSLEEIASMKPTFAEHGINDINQPIYIGLEKELHKDANGNREYTQSQRALAGLLQDINRIINGKQFDSNILNDYQKKLEAQKPELKKAAISDRQGSGYLMSGQAGKNDTYSFISRGTALELNKFDSRKRITKDNVRKYLDTMGGAQEVYNLLGGSDSDDSKLLKGALEGDTKGKSSQIRSVLDKVNEAFIQSIIDMSNGIGGNEADAAAKFSAIISRSPYLTMFSSLGNETIVRGVSEGQNGTPVGHEYADNVAYLSERAQLAMKADFDGDIIPIYRRVIESLEEFGSPEAKEAAQQFENYINDIKSKTLDEVLKQKHAEEQNKQAVGEPNFFQKIKEEAPTITDSNLKTSIDMIQASGQAQVGLKNWDDEQRRSAVTYYANEKLNGKGTEEFIAGSDILSVLFTEQGQQNNISAKQIASMLLQSKQNETGTITTPEMLTNFYNDLAKNNILSQDQVDYFKNNEDQALRQMAPMLAKAFDSDQMRLSVAKFGVLAEKSGDQTRKDNAAKISSAYNDVLTTSSDNVDALLENMRLFMELVEGLNGMQGFMGMMNNYGEMQKVKEYKNDTLKNVSGINTVASNSTKQKNKVSVDEYKSGKKSAETAGGNADKSNLLSGSFDEYLSIVTILLKQIVDNTSRVGGTGGGPGSAKGGETGWQYKRNEIWDKIANGVKDDKINKREGFESTYQDKVKFNAENHTYGVGPKNNKADFSATQLGAIVAGTMSEADSATFGNIMNTVKTSTHLTNDQVQTLLSNDFKFSNSMEGLAASSLLGNLKHAAFQGYGLYAKQNDKTLDKINETEYDITEFENYKQAMNQLVNFFGGNEEVANKFIEKHGNGWQAFSQGVQQMKDNGASMDSSRYAFEKPMAFTAKYKSQLSGETKEKTIGVTPDMISYTEEDGKITGFKAFDLKNKNASGQMSTQDIIEGLVQTSALASVASGPDAAQNLSSFMKNTFGKEINAEQFDDATIKTIRENTLNNLTSFIRTDQGKTALANIGVNAEGMNTEDILSSILQYADVRQANMAPVLQGENLPISQENNFADYVQASLDAVNNLNESLAEAIKLKTQLLKGHASDEDIAQIDSTIEGLENKAKASMENLQKATSNGNNLSSEQVYEKQQHDAKLYNARQDLLDQQEKQKKKADGAAQKDAKQTKDQNRQRSEGNGLMGALDQGLAYRIRQFFSFGLAQKVLGTLTSSIKKLISYTEQLNKSMVNLQIATGYSDSETKSLLKTYSNFASEIGKTTTEVADAANDWLRAGYEGKEASELVEASMYLSTLGMMNASQATESLISILKGWKLASEDVIDIVDRLVTIDMSAAVE